jgi:hypothetical protein
LAILSTELKLAVNAANAAVFNAFRGEGGSTIAAIFSSASGTAAATVGDTRIYQCLSRSQKIIQLSLDDTIAAELKRIRGPDANGEPLDPYSNRLAQFVGMGSDMDPRMYRIGEKSKDCSFLLSSDGAYSMPPSIFEAILRQAPTPFQAVSRLLQLSRWCGGKDNATIVAAPLASLTGSDLEPADSTQRLEIWDSFGKLDIVVLVGVTGEREQHPRAAEREEVATPGKVRRDRQRRKGAPGAAHGQPEQQPPGSSREKRRSENRQRELKIQVQDDDSGVPCEETGIEIPPNDQSGAPGIEPNSDRSQRDQESESTPELERDNT